MARSDQQRYMGLRKRLSLHQQRLGLLLLGTLLGGWLVTEAAVLPPSAGQTGAFSPFAPFLQPDEAAAPPPAAESAPPPAEPAVQPPQPVAANPALPTPALAPTFFDDVRLTSEQGLDVPTIQAFLDSKPGPLKSLVIPVGDRNQTVAELVVGQGYLYGLNPKLLLALLEFENQLITNPAPDVEAIDWALNFKGEDERWQGLYPQLRWAARELRRGVRDYPYATELVYAPDGEDEVRGPIPPGLNPATFAIVRLLAQTRTPAEVEALLADLTFPATYATLFEDPRQPLPPLPPPAEPFLRMPMARVIYVTSFFDHDAPFLTPNGSLVSWWGRRETALSYDGHDGWDYGLRPPEPILAAAAGTVVWAGNSDDGCGIPARGVVIEHGNGYRTLYWHLSDIAVELGQAVNAGDRLGIAGDSGCAIGPHLHFQTQYLGRNTDPYGWCSSEPDPWAVHPMGVASRWLWADRPNPCAMPADALLVTQRSPGFTRTGDGWNTAPIGVGGETLWIPSQVAPLDATQALTDTLADVIAGELPAPTADPALPAATATWRPELPQPGRYRVRAYVPYFLNGLEDATRVTYAIHHAEGVAEVNVNQFNYANEWVDLGTYQFDPGQDVRVELANRSEQPNQGVWVGAVLWEPRE